MSHRWLALALVPLLCGCFSSLKVPAPEIHEYRLDYEPPAASGTPLSAVLQLARFRSAAINAREAIVYREGDHETGTYPYHRWVATPASMIADLWARDFAASGLYRAVQQGATLLMPDYELGADIDEFEERVLPGGCAAHVNLRVLLFRTRASDNPVLLRDAYGADEPCNVTGPSALVSAMSRAVRQISERLQQDVYDAIKRDLGGKR